MRKVYIVRVNITTIIMYARNTDFIVDYDPAIDDSETVTRRILYATFLRRLKHKKPVIMFIGGDSGEGKSIAALRLQELLLEIQGLDIKEYLKDINVYTPIQYPEKLKRLLFDERLKKVNIITMHEAREIIKAKLWYNFLNQAISDINAQARSVKRLMTIIISQFIRDISSDIRYTLNYYCKVSRPLGYGKKSRLTIYVLWKDDRDLEKPKLRKRFLAGYLRYPNGRMRRFVPSYLEISLPPKEVIDEFEQHDYEAKASIIKRKIDTLIKDMELELNVGNKKIDTILEYYTKNEEMIKLIGKQTRKGFSLRPDFKDMHDLTTIEAQTFSKRLFKELEKKGMKEVTDDDLPE